VRGLTDQERESLVQCRDGLCQPACGSPAGYAKWRDPDQSDAVDRLFERGLVQWYRCQHAPDIRHGAITALGRLALEIDELTHREGIAA
jgi:hypothetical protein